MNILSLLTVAFVNMGGRGKNILSLCKYFISSHGCLRKYGEDEEKIFYLFANILSLLTVVFVNMGRTRRKARNQGLEISS